MKTTYGKLVLLALGIFALVFLLLPMRAGEEDHMIIIPGTLKMNLGDSYQINTVISSDNPEQYVRYSSANDKVATITPMGVVYGIASGETEIHAVASGGAKAVMKVIVAGVPMSRLELNAEELHIEKGQFSGLRADYNSDASDTRLQWISEDESIARVDEHGRIEGVGGGMTYVSVLAPNGLTDTARVYVDVAGIAAHISPHDLTLGVGARVQLQAMFLPLDCTDTVRRWISSDPSVASVDANGMLTAHGEGRAYISMASSGGLSAGMEVVVEPAPKDMQLNPAKATLERGSTMQLQVMFLNADGTLGENTSHHVVWSSDNTAVARVDQNGVVTARSGGSARITASSDGFTAECRVQVEVNIQEITLNHKEIELLREETSEPVQLAWSFRPADPDDATVRFESSNPQVANVSDGGLITFTGGYGTAVIRAYAASGAEASCTVSVVTQRSAQAE